MRVTNVLMCGALGLIGACGLAAGATWKEVDAGLPHSPAAVTGVVIDPSSPATVYALGWTLFKSTDSGGTWNALGGVSGVSVLAISPSDSSRLYAVAHGTVLQSWDGGQSWVNTGFNLASANTLAIDPRNGSILYALTFDALFKSTDAGATWTDETPVFAGGFHGAFLAIDPSNTSTIYVSGNGLYKSTDGGESWREVAIENGFCGCPVAVDPAHPSTVYATLLRFDQPSLGENVFRLFKSTDAGETWSLADAGIPGFANSIVIDSSSAIYASYITQSQTDDSGGVVKSTDGGASWTTVNTGLPSSTPQINSLALNPANPSTVLASYFDYSSGRGGVFRTFDGAATWSDASAGLTTLDVHALAVDPSRPATIYAASSGISKTSDGGASWQTVSFPSPGFGAAVSLSLVIDPNNSQVLYASVESAGGCSYGESFLRKSTDGGMTWNVLAAPEYCAFGGTVSLALDPIDSNTLYAAPEDIADCGTPLDVTTDGGTDWNQIYINGYVTALAIDPFNRTTLYIGTSSWPRGILQSTDAGQTWSATGLTNVDVSVLAVDPSKPGVLYAAIAAAYPDGRPSLVKSIDSGATWSPINTGLAAINASRIPITALVLDNQNATLYLGTSGGGVFRSPDGGANWSALNDGLPSLNVQALAVSPDGSGTVYAATPSGVFRAIDKQAVVSQKK